MRTASEVGVVEPPAGSVLTSTISTPFMSPVTEAVAEPSLRGVKSAEVGSGALARRAGPRPCRSCPPARAAGRWRRWSRCRRYTRARPWPAAARNRNRTCGRRRRRRAAPPATSPTSSIAQASAASAARGNGSAAAPPNVNRRRFSRLGGRRGPAARGGQQRGLALDLGHDPRLQRGRRDHRRRRDGQRLRGDAQLVDLRAAGRRRSRGAPRSRCARLRCRASRT